IEKRGSFMEKILQVDKLHDFFLTNERVFEAVKVVSFLVYKGETLVFVGESVSGKSVTAGSIMQLLTSPLSLKTEERIDASGQKGALIFQERPFLLTRIVKWKPFEGKILA